MVLVYLFAVMARLMCLLSRRSMGEMGTRLLLVFTSLGKAKCLLNQVRHIMKILAIETSCDETAIAILDCAGDEKSAQFIILGNALLSQVEIHKEYGGVFPALAKREHAKNLVPILEAALEEAELLHEDTQAIPEETRDKIATILSGEPSPPQKIFEFVSECEPP